MASTKDNAEEIARARLAYLNATQALHGASPARRVTPPDQDGLASVAITETTSTVRQADHDGQSGPQPSGAAFDARRHPQVESHSGASGLLARVRDRGFRISASHAATLIAVLLFAAVIAAVTLSQTSASTIPESKAPQVAVSSASPSASPVVIRVHVIGQVANPGVVEVESGAIVADAIEAAGGLTEDADPLQLNLAAKLNDGDQINIGSTASPAGEINGSAGDASGGGSASGLVNLNTASTTELEELPGIGPVLAQAIVDWREENGNFTDVSQLQEVSGVGPKVQEKLNDLVTV